MKIEGSIILVTGGASGIGEKITLYLVNKKAFVFICDLQEEKGIKLEKENPDSIKFIKCDITIDDQVREMMATVKSLKGRLDMVVNCAGIAWGELIANEKSIHNNDNFKKIWNINTYGTFLVSKYSAKLMIENANTSNECNGVIVMISSLAGIEGQRGQTAYSASKGAIIGMTLPMARDLGKYKIRVNTIAPGIIETPMTKGMEGSKFYKSIIDQTPLSRVGKPEHIAITVDFILQNDFLNGTVIRVDGGVRFPQF